MEEAKEMKDYYSILGVSKDADEVVIKAAYKALAQKYHPDKSQSETAASSTKLMSDINKAYSVIGNPVSKQKYDQELFGSNHLDVKMKATSTVKPKQPAPVCEKYESEPKESQLPAIIFGIVAWGIGIYYIVTNIKN